MARATDQLRPNKALQRTCEDAECRRWAAKMKSKFASFFTLFAMVLLAAGCTKEQQPFSQQDASLIAMVLAHQSTASGSESALSTHTELPRLLSYRAGELREFTKYLTDQQPDA